MMIKYVVVALIVSIDSFFVGMLTSEKAIVNILVLLLSPLFHIISCLFGFLIQQNLNTLVGRSLSGILVLIALIAGSYLVFAYKPRLEAVQRLRPLNRMVQRS